MTTRTAQCRCGQLNVTCEGEPVRISVCHCLDCQRRSGSAFAVQARWPTDSVVITGDSTSWTQTADSGNKIHSSFCPRCGSTVTYTMEKWPGVIAVAVGAFADPTFPAPKFSVWEHRKHGWLSIDGPAIDHST